MALRLTGSPDDATDLVQDTLLRAYTSLGRFRAEAAFGTWLYRIGTNLCLDALRQRKHQPKVAAFAPPGGDDPSPAWERQQLIQKALSELPPDLRTAVILRDIQGFPYAEIASIVGISLDNVKSRLHRAHCLLRHRFTELELLPSTEGRKRSS